MVAHNRGPHLEKLPSDLGISWQDSEIALYDDFRVDVFGGNPRGTISHLHVFSNAYQHYPTLHRVVKEYFDALWQEGEPGLDFIHELKLAYDAARQRIDYTSNWLALYEYSLEREDQALKTAESKRVVELLGELGRQGQIFHYLDIGTCTGRYPRELRDHVRSDGRILGIDVDEDCVQFSRDHPEIRARQDPRISFELMDFNTTDPLRLGQFDLITCMMSTFSHFGWDRNPRYRDTFQHALHRVRGLMQPDSVFIFSMYSEQARDRRNLLKIFQKQEVERLAEGTPGPVEIHRRLAAAGLKVIREAKPDLRLDIYVCQSETSGN